MRLSYTEIKGDFLAFIYVKMSHFPILKLTVDPEIMIDYNTQDWCNILYSELHIIDPVYCDVVSQVLSKM